MSTSKLAASPLGPNSLTSSAEGSSSGSPSMMDSAAGYWNSVKNYFVTSVPCCTERSRADENGSSGLGSMSSGEKGSSGGHSSGSSGSQSEVSMFNRAVSKKDVTTLTKLLDSDTRLPSNITSSRRHPWADQAKSIGALAAVQFAVFGSDRNLRQKTVATTSAVEKLAKYLSSGQNDRIHAALVALSYLTIEEPSACRRLAPHVDSIMPFLSDSISGARLASLSILRNIYTTVDSCKTQFVDNGGINQSVKLLSISLQPASGEPKIDEIYEIVMDLKDLIETSGSSPGVNESFARKAAKDGAIPALKRAAEVSKNFDVECAREADELAKKLQKYA